MIDIDKQRRLANPMTQRLREEVMTLKQVAAYFKVSQITVHRLTHRGALPGVKIGRQWRYLRSNIEHIVQPGFEMDKEG